MRCGTFLGSVILTAGLLAVPALTSATDSSVRHAREFVRQMSYRGYRLTSSDSDSMPQGYHADYRVTLLRKVTYVIFAAGNSNADDLGIYVYDENGKRVAHDRETDNSPVVQFTPKWTGEFTVRIKMYQAEGVAGYTMGVLHYCGCEK